MKNKPAKKARGKKVSRAQKRAQARKAAPKTNPFTQMTTWVAGLVAIIPLLYSTRTMDPPITVRHMFFSLFALAFALVFGWLAPKSYEIKRDRLTKIFFGFLAGFFVWNIVSLLGATNVQEGYQLIARYALLFGAIPLFMAMAVQEEDKLKNIWKAAAVISMVTALMGILHYFGVIFKDQLTLQDPPYALRSNRNMFASAQVLLVPFTLLVALREKGIWTWVSGISLALSLYVIILAQTRGAWLSFAGIMVLMTIGSLLARDSIGKEIGKRALRLSLAVVPAVALLLTLTLVTDSSGKLSRSLAQRSIGTSSASGGGQDNIASSSVSERLFLWKNSLQMSADHPVLGVGAGNWRIVIPTYGTEEIVAATGLRISLRPHNMFLQVLDETGIPGLLLFLGMWVVLAVICIKSFFSATSTDRKLLVLVMTTVVAAFVIDIMVSFGNERIENTLYLTLAIGVLLGLYEKADPEAEAEAEPFILAKPWVIGLMALFVFSFVFAYARYSYEVQFNLAKAYYEIGNGPRALQEARKGKSSLITLAPNGTPIEMYSAQGHSLQKQYGQALRELELGLTYNPTNSPVLNNIGTCYTNMEQFEQAIVYYKKALEVTPDNGNTRKNLAINLYNLKRYQECLDVISSINISGDEYFQNIQRMAEENLRAQTGGE